MKYKGCKENLKDAVLDLLEKDTFTNEEICKELKIEPSTLWRWRQSDPVFARKYEEARSSRLLENLKEYAEHSLKRVIEGYRKEDIKKVYALDKDGKPRLKERVVNDTEVAPNVGAIIFVLTNADPTLWKNRQQQDVSAKVDTKVEERFDPSSVPEDILKAVATYAQKAEHEQKMQ